MTYKSKNILLILVLASCAGKNGKSTIKFFHRSNDENNQEISCEDFLAITRYSEKPYTAMELYKIAKK